jgi:hypothetical protein
MRKAVFYSITAIVLTFLGGEIGKAADVNQYLNELESAPPWGKVDDSQESKAHTHQLMTALTDIARNLSQEDCRTLLSEYVEHVNELPRKDLQDILNKLSKAFILNRVYFNVPKWDGPEALKYMGGWLPSPPKNDGKFGVLFPLEMTSNGDLKLVASGFTYYGGAYNPLLEFDLFQGRYGARWRK